MYKNVKRILDFIFSFLLIIGLLPLLLIISILVKLSSKGPVIFKQNRLGRHGKVFRIYKFRTMINNAESLGTKLDSFPNDRRVTRIGRLLRVTGIDELPQLFNILFGSMSFIGPRPPVTYHPYNVADYPEEIKKRFFVRPGVTGLAQINGRNALKWEEKFKFDLIYIDDFSFRQDCIIFFKTIKIVLTGKGRYDE